VIDEGNREALRIECGSSSPSTRLLRVMNELIEFYGKRQAIRMDNGPEMTSAKFISWAEQQGIELRYIQPGKPNQNGPRSPLLCNSAPFSTTPYTCM
jgi:putative transposase